MKYIYVLDEGTFYGIYFSYLSIEDFSNEEYWLEKMVEIDTARDFDCACGLAYAFIEELKTLGEKVYDEPITLID